MEQYWQLLRQFIPLHSSYRLVYVIVGITDIMARAPLFSIYRTPSQ